MATVVREVGTTILGNSPVARCQLNGGAFVQDCLVTRRGWQYAAFYLDNQPGVRHVCLARRQLPSGAWDRITFTDYDQIEDDGHNVISLGICDADGSIHFSFDAHDTPLHYRHSLVDLTSEAANAQWRTESFSKVLDHLPGLEHLSKAEYFEEITYPRFVSVSEPPGALVFEYRIGISGLGSDLMCIYTGSADDGGAWRHRGVYLQGVQNNPYINGIDADLNGTLHVSWTYRDYVTVTLEQSRQQAGPNGPENNHDLCYAYSPPEKDGSGPGVRWYASDGRQVGTSSSSPILPSTSGILAFNIPKYSGILNQEAQCIAPRGGFHVLNRELIGGVVTWFVYSLIDGKWAKEPLPVLPPSQTSARGKILVSRKSERLLVLLPLAQDLLILTRPVQQRWEKCFVVPNAGGEKGMEVLYDRKRLAFDDGILSLFLGCEDRASRHKTINVVDLDVDAEC